MNAELTKMLADAAGDTRLSKAARLKFVAILTASPYLVCGWGYADARWNEADIGEIQELVTLGYLDWNVNQPERRAVHLPMRYFNSANIERSRLMRLVSEEMAQAQGKHLPMQSLHEAYAVILEEVEEVWDEVRKRNPDPKAIYNELLQVAAMSCRAIHDLGLLPAALPEETAVQA